jgi:dihydrodipicolinate synthase/N-acetylneuraminate lyase
MTEIPPQPVAAARVQILERLLPEGVPLLWCPPLTHYKDDGTIDAPRMAAHFRHLSVWVRGFLIPGSTGDGWELTDEERRQVLTIVLGQAAPLNLRLLLGVLKPQARDTVATIQQDVAWLKARVREPETEKALLRARVCGFTVCPPRGKDLPQAEIGRGLASVLELGVPTAIYQLPQVTQNELSPEVAAELAGRFPNFIFFKDTSGADRVVLSGLSLGGVFTTRGAEGDYARWLDRAGGPYRGFLLSTANCFARELHQVISDICGGHFEAARQLSNRLTQAVNGVFPLVTALLVGNAFTNANKAIDHFFAHGPQAASAPPPRLHAGGCLPEEVIRATGDILSRCGLMPGKGYLE